MFYAFENAGKRNFGFPLPFPLLTRKAMACRTDVVDDVWRIVCVDLPRTSPQTTNSPNPARPAIRKLWKTELTAVVSMLRTFQGACFSQLASVDILVHNEDDFSHVPEISPTTIFHRSHSHGAVRRVSVDIAECPSAQSLQERSTC